MGKRARQRKRQAASIARAIQEAEFRNSNGQATPADVDMLIRWRLEAEGKDGYTGMAKGSRGYFVSAPKSDPYKFSTKYDQPKGEDGVFHCAEAAEVTSKCPLNPYVPHILVDYQMWECFIDLTKEYDTEWIALLIGKLGQDVDKKPAYVIEKFYFPPQNASGAHVDVPTGVKPRPGTIGAIHSHVNMGVFWSATDTAHSNWPVEIVINRKGDYKAIARHQLKCGEWAKSDATVYTSGNYVNAGIKAQMDKAFALGEAMYKATSTTKDKVPAGVADDDKAEVAEAIVKVGKVNDTLTSQGYELCTTEGCVRIKDHPGYHKKTPVGNDANDYFQVKPIIPGPQCTNFLETGTTKYPCQLEAGHSGLCKTSEGVYWWSRGDDKQAKITFPPITFPPSHLIGDDPTVQGSEEYCEECEGTGLVEVMASFGGVIGVDKCDKCKGDGLSEIGKVRQAEDKKSEASL